MCSTFCSIFLYLIVWPCTIPLWNVKSFRTFKNRRKYWGCRDIPGSICFLSAVKTAGYKKQTRTSQSTASFTALSLMLRIHQSKNWCHCNLLLLSPAPKTWTEAQAPEEGPQHGVQAWETIHDVPDDIRSSSQARQSRDFSPEFLLWSLCHHGPWDANALPQPFRNDDTGAHGGEQENSLWPAVP